VISFLALRNGRLLGAGGVQEGVLTAIVTRVTEKPGRRPAELAFRLSGLETSQPQEEHVHWIDVRDLRPGDEITIRVQDGPGDPPTQRRPGFHHGNAPDGPKQFKCSFCHRFRDKKGCVAGANGIICFACRVLGSQLLEREAPSVFHLRLQPGAPCSFCYRPERSATVVAGAVGMCSECIAAVPFTT
jgi:hypothetical protein